MSKNRDYWFAHHLLNENFDASQEIRERCPDVLEDEEVKEIFERYEEYHKKAKMYKSILEDMLDRKATD